MRLCLFLLFTSVSFCVNAQVQIENPWSRATPPGAKVAAGYLTVRNKSAAPDRLLGGSSPVAARVETHTMEMKGDVMRMREAKGFEVPANGSVELKPGGAHLMLVDIKRPLKEGERVPVTLRFEKAGEVKTELEVQPLGAMKPHGH